MGKADTASVDMDGPTRVSIVRAWLGEQNNAGGVPVLEFADSGASRRNVPGVVPSGSGRVEK